MDGETGISFKIHKDAIISGPFTSGQGTEANLSWFSPRSLPYNSGMPDVISISEHVQRALLFIYFCLYPFPPLSQCRAHNIFLKKVKLNHKGSH